MIGAARFQQGSLSLVKNKTAPDTWYFRFYSEAEGRRVYRKQRIGTVKEFPRRRDAEKAILSLRAKINSEVRSPETVSGLIEHFTKHELCEASNKRSSTREVYAGFLKLHVKPIWGDYRLDQVKTIAVEKWLHTLDLAPATRTKIKAIMSTLFAHAKRHGMVAVNPIEGVRSSSKRLRDPDVLTPAEFSALLEELPQRERVMVLLAGTTGLRRSELIALRWEDVNFDLLQVEVRRSCVRAQLGETKTLASNKPVPLHSSAAAELKQWRLASLYTADMDYLFPSIRNNGTIPVWPDMVLRKTILPAAKKAGIIGKRLGWHTFRHSLGTNLRALGVDIKTAQELLRHANVGITLNLYSQAISSQKREANERLVELMLPSFKALENPQHLSAPLEVNQVSS